MTTLDTNTPAINATLAARKFGGTRIEGRHPGHKYLATVQFTVKEGISFVFVSKRELKQFLKEVPTAVGATLL